MTCVVCQKNRGLLAREGCCFSCWSWIRDLFANRHRLASALREAGGC